MALRNIRGTVAGLAVAATLLSVYFGRGSMRSPDELAAAVSRRYGDNRTAARRWMNQLPPEFTSAEAMLKLIAIQDDSASSAVQSLHRLLDHRRARPHESDAEFVQELAASLAEVSKSGDLPPGVADELAIRLLNWPDHPELDGQGVARQCADVLQAASRQVSR